MNHTSRGSKETLALLKLRTYAFNLINWTNGGMKSKPNWTVPEKLFCNRICTSEGNRIKKKLVT